MSGARHFCKNERQHVMCLIWGQDENECDKQQLNCSVIEDFDLGTALQELYPILSNVFQYLSAKDLKNAARINDVWKDYANKELSKRRKCASFHISKRYRKFELCKSSSFDNVNFGSALVFGSTKLKQYRKICTHLDGVSELDSVLGTLKAKLVGSDVRFFGYMLSSIFPFDTGIACSGIILPRIPNLVIEEYNANRFITSISKAFDKGLQLRALMYFCDQRSSSHERSLKINLEYLLSKQDQRTIALGGGLITARMGDFFDVAHNSMRAVVRGFQFGIAFLSPKDDNNFQGYSIVVQETSCYTAKLKEAKPNIVLKKHSTAFLFQCSAIDVPQMESAFWSAFPTVDFITVKVEGEIGWDNYGVTDDTDVSPAKKCKYVPEFVHAYSVVILLLTWD